MTDADLVAAALLAALGGLALVALHGPLSATAFDDESASALGVRPGLVRLALLGLVAAAVAIAVQGLGALLSLALLVAPAIAVRRRSTSAGRALVAGAVVGALGGAAGIYLSYYAGTAAGASVALALCAAAALGALPTPRRAAARTSGA